MIETKRLKIYAASRAQMEAFIAAQRVLIKAGFLPAGRNGDEGPRFVFKGFAESNGSVPFPERDAGIYKREIDRKNNCG